MQFVGGAGIELGDEVKVEVAGRLGLIVDEQAATGDVVADCCDALHHVVQAPHLGLGAYPRPHQIDVADAPPRRSSRRIFDGSYWDPRMADCPA